MASFTEFLNFHGLAFRSHITETHTETRMNVDIIECGHEELPVDLVRVMCHPDPISQDTVEGGMARWSLPILEGQSLDYVEKKVYATIYANIYEIGYDHAYRANTMFLKVCTTGGREIILDRTLNSSTIYAFEGM